MPLEIRTGALLAGFRVDSLLGEGAMGTVYLAEEVATGRRIALKLLAPELARDERFRRRFLRETELAASLDHPHVVPTLASGEEEGTLYLAMAYVEGADLRKLLRHEGRLEPERALDLVEQVADALDAAHRAGLVHRDVKPGNILVTQGPDGEHAYVCDFGLARHVSSVSSLTSERGFVGTIDYVPPEQVEGGRIDGRADVYSLGCVLYECLSGARPFDRETELSVLFAHLNDPPPRITDARPDLPEAFDTVFETGLAKSPDDRYSTCGELAAAARAALQGRVLARRRRRRRRGLVAAGLLVIAGGAAAAAVLATQQTPARTSFAAQGQPISVRPSALNLIDAKTRRVDGRVGLGTSVPIADTRWNLAFTKRAAWVLLGAKQRLVRIALATHKVTTATNLPFSPGAITASGNSVWVTEDNGPNIWEIDARTGKISSGTLRGGDSEGDVAYGAGSLWLGSGRGVVRVDPANGRIQRMFGIEGTSGGMQIVFADGAVYAARPGSGTVVKIDPAANRILHRTKLHGWVSDLAVGGGFVWVSIVPDGAVYKLSEDELGVLSTNPAGSDPEQISFGGGGLWVANPTGKTVSYLAEISGKRQRLAAEAEPTTAAYHDGLVWVGASPALAPLPPIKGQELRIAGGGVPFDPVHNGLWDEQVLYATCANLLNYPDSAGADGARLRPEIAAAMPTLSADKRTYTFRIRPGFRFSPPSNEPVTAETFRHTIEREIATKDNEVGIDRYVSDIVGAPSYFAGKARHVSGIAVHGNRLSFTLVKPAGDFLTRISLPRFCPVPLSVPVRGGGDHPISSAGPYYIASSAGGRDVLERNPSYPGDRPRRSERIVVEENLPEAKAVALADRGAVDLIPPAEAGALLSIGGPLDQRSRTSSAVARQYHLYQGPLIDYFVFNTRRPLFRNPRVRLAVDYALDRRALASKFGDTPDDQIVPPAVRGYPAGRIFPLSHDVATARRLAGGRSRSAVLYICGDPRERTLAQIVTTDLAKIRISVSVLEDEQCPAPNNVAAVRKSKRADLLLVSGWPYTQSDERDPEPVLDQALSATLYGSAPPPGPWSTSAFRMRLAEAQPLRGPARVKAYRHLADELSRTGPLAVFGSWAWPEYFSPEVGCKVFQSVYLVADLGELCKRT
jgi:ABC-type transport system substrate-binding protein/tRNA A-37 threonylcarbamoyl transferase component Bud32